VIARLLRPGEIYFGAGTYEMNGLSGFTYMRGAGDRTKILNKVPTTLGKGK
jgi:hypothetical protein